jgi:hypothetical protein
MMFIQGYQMSFLEYLKIYGSFFPHGTRIAAFAVDVLLAIGYHRFFKEPANDLMSWKHTIEREFQNIPHYVLTLERAWKSYQAFTKTGEHAYRLKRLEEHDPTEDDRLSFPQEEEKAKRKNKENKLSNEDDRTLSDKITDDLILPRKQKKVREVNPLNQIFKNRLKDFYAGNTDEDD